VPRKMITSAQINSQPESLARQIEISVGRRIASLYCSYEQARAGKAERRGLDCERKCKSCKQSASRHDHAHTNNLPTWNLNLQQMDFWLEEKFATLYCSLDRREGTRRRLPGRSRLVQYVVDREPTAACCCVWCCPLAQL